VNIYNASFAIYVMWLRAFWGYDITYFGKCVC